MNVEQRLMQALRHTDRVEPSPDLWSRVVHSIDEDRRHRRRVVGTAAGIICTSLALIAAGALAITDTPGGRIVHGPTLEILEAIALVTAVVALGPAIRRFGRGYAADLWPPGGSTPQALLKLMDVAYYLVGAGYILLSTEFEFGAGHDLLAGQLAEAAARLGGLLLVLGILHAGALAALPIVALVDNSTRTGTRLRRKR
jgi:hypothetical protein